MLKVIENQLSEIDATVGDFLRVECSIQWSVIYCGAYSEHHGNKWEHDKWSFTFTRTGVVKAVNFDYHTGVGHRGKRKKGWAIPEVCAVKPGPAGIIYSLIMNKSACEQSFSDWCDECGHDSDSRKAFSIYEQCQNEYDKVRRILTNREIEALMEMLQDY
jgi:hypothetical protein